MGKGKTMDSSIYNEVIKHSRVPEERKADWLDGAMDSVKLLNKAFSNHNEVILLATNAYFYVHALLVPNTRVENPDHEDLLNIDVNPSDTWHISEIYNHDGDSRFCMASPFDGTRCRSLIGGEKVVTVRDFEGVKDCPRIDVSQKIVHCLGLHWNADRSAYCLINGEGEEEKIIYVYSDNESDFWRNVRAVIIKRIHIERYLALSEMSLVTKFCFRRYIPMSKYSWNEKNVKIHKEPDLYFRHHVTLGESSVAEGHMIFRASIDATSSLLDWQKPDAYDEKKYASFKIYDMKNKKLMETSCGPKYVSNYFTESELPWETSPAFFNPEVLTKYRSNSEKYTIQNGTISCRNSWYLRSYDINTAGQVHAYLCDLAELPYREQLYWASFNEWPKAGISSRAFKSDFLAEFSNEDDPLEELRSIIKRLNKERFSWWSNRDEHIIDGVQVLATDSVEAWGNELLALDKLTVEGFKPRGLKKVIHSIGDEDKESFGSIDLLKYALQDVGGISEDRSQELVEPLKEIHRLRNDVQAHSSAKRRRSAESLARREHDDLRVHFNDIVSRTRDTMKFIEQTLS